MDTVRDTAAQCRPGDRRAPFPEWGGERTDGALPDRGGRRVPAEGMFRVSNSLRHCAENSVQGEYDTSRGVSMSGTTRLGYAILVAALLAGCGGGSGTMGPNGGGGGAGGGGGGGGGNGGGGNG